MELRDAYARAHERVVRLLEDDVAGVEVPTCPGWTIRDMAAHLAGFFGAYKTGKGMEAFGEGWAEREIDARKDKSFRECIEEWTEHVRDPGDLFESPLGPVAVADVLAHEQDIRTALNVPGARDDESIVPSVEMALSFLGKKAGDELPTLKIVTEDLERQIGDGEPAATLRTSTFELFRTLHGRRTIDQIRALDWEGDAEPWTTSLFIFGPTKEVVETS